MNQKVMKIHFRTPGDVTNGDIVQCPICRKKFVVLPGLQQFKIGGGVDVICSECTMPTPADYYKEVSKGEIVELPQKRRRKKEEGE